jgi:hypothetical protein
LNIDKIKLKGGTMFIPLPVPQWPASGWSIKDIIRLTLENQWYDEGWRWSFRQETPVGFIYVNLYNIANPQVVLNQVSCAS